MQMFGRVWTPLLYYVLSFLLGALGYGKEGAGEADTVSKSKVLAIVIFMSSLGIV